MARETKRRLEILVGRYTLNPLIRLCFRIGISPPRTVLIETVGRKTNKIRHIPVNYVREGQTTLWIIAQHGSHAGWVRNIEAQPRIRARLGRTWYDGTARLVPDDDVRARMRTFANGRLGGALAAGMFRTLETAPASLRIDLDAR